MTWIFSISPEIPGLAISANGDKAMLHGHPMAMFSGIIMITASDGTRSISTSFQLDLYPLSKISIAAIENNSELTDSIAIESRELKATVLQGRVLIESVPIVPSTLPSQITFTSD